MGVQADVARVISSGANRGVFLHSAATGLLFLWSLLHALYHSSLSGTASLVFLFHCTCSCLIQVFCEALVEGPGAQSHNPLFPFGLARLKILLTYGNVCVLMFFSLTTLVEGVECLILGNEPTCQAWIIALQLVSHASYEMLLGAKVPMYGAGSFARKGLIVRVVRRCIPATLALVSCVFDSAVSEVTAEGTVDAVCAIASSYYCLFIVWPHAKQCCNVLLQKMPGRGVRVQLDKARREVQGVPGVLEVSDARFWSVKEGDVAGSMRVRVRQGTPVQTVLTQVRQLFASMLNRCCVQIDTDSETVMQRMASFPSSHSLQPPPVPASFDPASHPPKAVEQRIESPLYSKQPTLQPTLSTLRASDLDPEEV